MSELATSSVNELIEESEKLKKTANEFFTQQKYEEAIVHYTLAIEKLPETNDEAHSEYRSLNELRSVLLANRAASYIGLKQFETALNDANQAILSHPQWVKAYYRKASALDCLGRFQDVVSTWDEASRLCTTSASSSASNTSASTSGNSTDPMVEKQRKLAQKKWKSVFLSLEFPVLSMEDLLSRYQLLTDKRERLSTLAHFWNDSTKLERFQFFQVLISLISGSGELSEATLERITPDLMSDMPLHNYPDLPRARIQCWANYFSTAPTEEKNEILKKLWNEYLSSEEKNDIIVDLKMLFSEAYQAEVAKDRLKHQAGGKHVAEDMNDLD